MVKGLKRLWPDKSVCFTTAFSFNKFLYHLANVYLNHFINSQLSYTYIICIFHITQWSPIFAPSFPPLPSWTTSKLSPNPPLHSLKVAVIRVTLVTWPTCVSSTMTADYWAQEERTCPSFNGPWHVERHAL